jgi:V8-like Glu-specific endopeptidase
MRRRERIARWLALAGVLAGSLAVPVVGAGRAGAVVGGVEVPSSTYPQFVWLPSQGCGSTVIARDTLLTAAHCVADLGQVPQGWISLTVHPLYNGDAHDGHDLAIIRVGAGLTDAAGITPIQVGSPWNPTYYAPDTPATIIGQGATQSGGPSTSRLRAVETVLRSDGYMDDIYNKWYSWDHWVEPLMIGAGSSHKTACGGDSGGPLLVDKNGTRNWVQVGVTSFGVNGCSNAAAFAELSGAQLAWIAREVPSVKDRWGTCYDHRGDVGQPVVRYQTAWNYPDLQRDGPFYWEISCEYLSPNPSPPPPPPPPPPPADPDDPPLTICDTQPWKCPDDLA